MRDCLVIDDHSQQVFQLPLSAFAVPNTCDSASRTRVYDLESHAGYWVNIDDLAPYQVPDDELGQLLIDRSVSGIHRPFLATPDNLLPIHGNLSGASEATILVGGTCNSHCTFCYTEWIRGAPPIFTPEIVQSLEVLRSMGTIQTVVFSGGEATLRPDLCQIMRQARSMGFAEIGLQTNGRLLAEGNLLNDLIDAGLSRVLLSLHGTTPEIHDSVTRDLGSFIAATQALNRLNELSLYTTISTVACRKNIDDIVGFPRFLLRSRYTNIVWRIAYPIIEGAAYDLRAQNLVPIPVFRESVLAAFADARAAGLRIQLGPTTPCAAPDPSIHRTYTPSALSDSVQVSPFYKENVPRGEVSIKLQSCRDCLLRDECRGIQIEYLKHYPDGHLHFVPIKRLSL
jgi:MoaA/NifB/PqqE/SkfB family radical SAM enzyme